MVCPNTRAGVKIVKKKRRKEKNALEQPKFQPPSLITTSDIAAGLVLVVPILVGRALPPLPLHMVADFFFFLPGNEGGELAPCRPRLVAPGDALGGVGGGDLAVHPGAAQDDVVAKAAWIVGRTGDNNVVKI